MPTILRSPTRTVRIGLDEPFVIIGERINPTGRKLLAAEMAAGNFDRVRADALAQVAAGAHVLDVNAGIPLAAYQGKALVNSVTGEDARLDSVLPLVAQYHAAVIGISNDEMGIAEDPDVRFEIAKKIVLRAEALGIPREDVLIDPLAMPVGAVRYAGRSLFRLTRRLQEELGVNTCCGASNISFGLPNRPALNATFLPMAICAGLACAITNPIKAAIHTAILAADVMMGRDENCQAWLGAERAARRAAQRLAAATAAA